MHWALKWAGRVGLGLAGAVVLAGAGVYAASENVRHKTWPKQPNNITASQGPEAVQRGARLAKLYGCHDCHGADLTGRLFHDEPALARITGANLTLALASQSDQDLARAIRTGVAADGRGLMVMPSAALSNLSDAETSDLLAYLRTYATPRGTAKVTLQAGPIGRLGMALGQFKSEPQMLADHPAPPMDLGPHYAEGRALVRLCMECHGSDLKGSAAAAGPDLAIAASYLPAGFTRLMRTGVAAGDRELSLMSPTARGRFAALSDAEIAALHGYLQARAEKQAAMANPSSK